MKMRNSRLSITIILCFGSTVLCSLDRLNISIAAPFIMDAYNWNEAQMGRVFSAFFVGYVLFMVPGSIVAHRFGTYKILAAGVGFWSLFTFLTPFFTSIWSLSICRFLIGVGQVVNFPCISNFIAKKVPLSHRTKIQGLTLSGLTFGAVLGFILGSWIIGILGWPLIFYLFGLSGIIWLLFWFYFGQNETQEDISVEYKKPIPWKDLIGKKAVLGLCISYFSHNYISSLFLFWLPTYFKQEYNFSLAGMGIGTALPALVSFLFMNISGWISDSFLKKGYSRDFSRKIMLYFGMGGAGILLMSLVIIQNPYLAVVVIVITSATKALSTPAYWTLAMDMAPEHSGFLSSLMNTSGNMSGIVAPMLSGWIVSYFASWDLALFTGSIVTLFGVLIARASISSSRLV